MLNRGYICWKKKVTGEHGRFQLPEMLSTTQREEAEPLQAKSDIMLTYKGHNNGKQSVILVVIRNCNHLPLDDLQLCQ